MENLSRTYDVERATTDALEDFFTMLWALSVVAPSEPRVDWAWLRKLHAASSSPPSLPFTLLS